ncbi:NGG1p interacting factor 3 [Neohortaea acidophila]|uniref:NGG1p interacting factor 3 n=1 Tax=Neohortaea acidophila TaxID=245834 RepID=A0A6A6Q4V4_9PEZI|nr:NGG1p interacting factor 3 [Neohortaea acidophila]KAF2487101.1 NGG1p interacting factor 3 [Neohortaea acidophila]
MLPIVSRATMSSAPYTRAVVSAMRKLYPEALADKSFDNTGLLLEAPFDPRRRQRNSVLLTIDLTKAVANEAIARQDSIVVAYHPIIFRGLKSLTLQDSQQQSLLRLAAAGISVYSPHTAVDCARGGLGDWLADIVTGTPTHLPSDPKQQQQQPHPSDHTSQQPQTIPKRPLYMLQHHPSQQTLQQKALSLGTKPHDRRPIVPTSMPNYSPEETGMGRIVRLHDAVPLTAIIDNIALGLGNPKGFPIAVPQGKQISDMMIRTIGICAGSGGHLFGELREPVDLLFTGEMSHHEALAAIEKGQCVIALFHSNTERGFLSGVLKGQLEGEIAEEWKRLRDEQRSTNGVEHDKDYLAALEDESIEVHVSEVDRDPYGIMIAKS